MIRLAASHGQWVLGYVDECWWSRLAQPRMHAWSEAKEGLRLQQLEVSKTDPDPKALCCYGLLRADTNEVKVRFVQGRPVSQVTIEFLKWGCKQLAQAGKKAWLLVWDNASWHKSHQVWDWIKTHNQQAKRQAGVRILMCLLPVKSPWLNPIEPHWVHGKRAIVEPERKLSAKEVICRVCDYFGCTQLDPISQMVS